MLAIPGNQNASFRTLNKDSSLVPPVLIRLSPTGVILSLGYLAEETQGWFHPSRDNYKVSHPPAPIHSVIIKNCVSLLLALE